MPEFCKRKPQPATPKVTKVSPNLDRRITSPTWEKSIWISAGFSIPAQPKNLEKQSLGKTNKVQLSSLLLETRLAHYSLVITHCWKVMLGGVNWNGLSSNMRIWSMVFNSASFTSPLTPAPDAIVPNLPRQHPGWWWPRRFPCYIYSYLLLWYLSWNTNTNTNGWK